MIGVADHVIAHFKLLFGKVHRVALIAGLDHFVAFALPIFLREPSQVGRFDGVDQCSWLTVGIENAKSFEDRGSVGSPLFVLRQRQADRKKSPCGTNFMVAILHVAGLAGWSSRIGGEQFSLFQIVANPMLGSRIHFPLRMIETHVAGFAGLRLLSFFDGKCVPRVAGIALGRTEFGAVLAQLDDFSRRLVADLVTPAASFLALGHRHRLPVNCGHGFHGRPRRRVLSFIELLDLSLMARGASFRRGNLYLGHVARGRVLVTVAGDTSHLELAVLAELPIRNNVGSDLAVAVHTLGSRT